MAVNLNVFKQNIIDIQYIKQSKQHKYLNDRLSTNIWNYYLINSQNYNLLDRKIKLKKKLSKTLSKYFNNENGLKFIDIFISGSTVNGFATIDSDIDLCFIVSNYYDFELHKSKKVKILAKIEEILDLNDFRLTDCQLIEARVPILRYTDSTYPIQVEININNEIGIRNTRLLYCYSKLDWRVVPTCISIKKWAKHYCIIDSFSGALSSYCIELMVIFYLQNCWPPILPCLQKTNPELFDPSADISSYKELPELDQLSPFNALNNQTLGELFIGFFKYYVFSFDFTKDVASVRLGLTIDKQQFTQYIPIPDKNQWEFICIEEPFSGCNTARTVYDRSGYNKVLDGFKQMYANSIDFLEPYKCCCD